MHELPGRLRDPGEQRRIAQLEAQFEGEYQAINMVGNSFEMIGGLVKNRALDSTMAYDYWGYVVLRNWNALAPVVYYMREATGDSGIWENFEYLASECKRLIERNPTSYPKGVPRMPEDRSLIDALCTDSLSHQL